MGPIESDGGSTSDFIFLKAGESPTLVLWAIFFEKGILLFGLA
jgi:hypothetical protein